MDIVNNTIYYKNTVNSTSYTEETSKVSKAAKVKSEEKINNSDSVELSTTDENVINTKKAYDTLCEVNTECVKEGLPDSFMADFLAISELMRDEGYSVPDFTSDNKLGFVNFIDQIKSYAEKLINQKSILATGSTVTSGFLSSCDLYKEKLIEYGCK